ncbi:MAG: thioredoxin domain-containing protein [Verrucomicrobiae bacterium]|nr:thioredoxin domain-containing protein [Verrucomicrobiae bacterium]
MLEEASCRGPNRLAGAKSPYLLQHASNPVRWHPWGEDAFALARSEDKPIFLSIGYSTCHWCHVMERESFESEAVAAVLNRHFVSIKVDREERPDVDKVYMTAVQAMGVGGGWPLSVWLTPDLRPFYGGTYFPPEGRFGRMGFIDLLRRIAQLWREDRDRILASAADMAAQIKEIAEAAHPAPGVPGRSLVGQGVRAFKEEFDWGHGGFGSAPKFPRPVVLRLLLRHARAEDDREAREMVFKTLEAMACGGMYDQLGGGFARYAVDAEWLVPHFEKMLYDNAQLIDAYLDAIQAMDSGEDWDPARRELFAGVVEDTAGYVMREMTMPEGGFCAAEDADSEGREGAFYVWTEGQVRAVLPGADGDFAVAALGVSAAGNFFDHSAPEGVQPPGENVLRRAMSPAEAASASGIPASEAEATWTRIRERLLRARLGRPRPLRDDKVLTSWNGLMIGALARAGALFGREDWVGAARRAADFLRRHQFDEATGRLGHSWRQGSAEGPELLDDYAFLAKGLIALHDATFDAQWIGWATRLCEEIVARFGDAARGGFFMAGEGGDRSLPARMKEDYDGAEPSGNSVAAQALIAIGRRLGREDFEAAAGRVLSLYGGHMERLPQAVPNLLSALDQWHEAPARVVLCGDRGSESFRELERVARSAYWPDLVIVRGGPSGVVRDPSGGRPPMMPEAQLCCDGHCEAPVSDPRALAERLRRSHAQGRTMPGAGDPPSKD